MHTWLLSAYKLWSSCATDFHRMEGEGLFAGGSDYSFCYQPLSSSSIYLIFFLTGCSSYTIFINMSQKLLAIILFLVISALFDSIFFFNMILLVVMVIISLFLLSVAEWYCVLSILAHERAGLWNCFFMNGTPRVWFLNRHWCKLTAVTEVWYSKAGVSVLSPQALFADDDVL